ETQHIDIIDLHSLLWYYLFANKKNNQKRRYEAQRKDTMVDGKTTTNFIPMFGIMLHYPIDRTGKALGKSV
ncbi:hypothetical protein, partial [Lutimonas sp.]|uniref:hypothetical protein n=1 Tax=Lutimonas sp. TaxID=1872403 RepID=UPI003C77CB76